MSKTNFPLLQKRIFEQILAKTLYKRSLVEELVNLLGISQSAAYKRIQGNVLLNLEELAKVGQHYQMSLDQLLVAPQGRAIFEFKALSQKPKSLEAYLQGLSDDLIALNKTSNPYLYYVSNDLPIFHYFLFPELLAFKLFIWGRTIWGWKGFQRKKFDLKKMLKDYPILVQPNFDLNIYQQIPSTEFWKEGILDHILTQVKYYQQNGVFAKTDDALVLCNQLKFLTQSLKEMALKETKALNDTIPTKSKRKEKNFHLFQNEISNTNNIILIQSREINWVYTTFDSPNYMVSKEPGLVSYTKDWFEKIQKRSKLISGSESSCLQFFNVLEEQILAVEREFDI